MASNVPAPQFADPAGMFPWPMVEPQILLTDEDDKVVQDAILGMKTDFDNGNDEQALATL